MAPQDPPTPGQPTDPPPPDRRGPNLGVVIGLIAFIVVAAVGGFIAATRGDDDPAVQPAASSTTTTTDATTSAAGPTVALDQAGQLACDTFARAVDESGKDIGSATERKILADAIFALALPSDSDQVSSRAGLLGLTAEAPLEPWLVAADMFFEVCGTT